MPLPKITMGTRQDGDLLHIDLTIGEEAHRVSRFLTDPSSCNFRVDRFELARMLHDLGNTLERGRPR